MKQQETVPTTPACSRDLLCCPKCGGDAGFFERKIMNYSQWCEWGGKAVESTDKETRGGKLKYCVDCGKNVTAFVNKLEKDGRLRCH